MARFVSFAQNLEDVMLWRLFSTINKGFYIDIGAGDPELDSVTAAFYKREWRGINVEANPNLFSRLQAARPDEINLNVAVGCASGMVDLFIVDDDDRLSTTQSEIAILHRQSGHPLHQVRIPVRSLREISADYVTGPVHFMKIDVEGGELEVMRGADFTACRPWIVLVEAIDPVTLLPSHATWEDILLGADYHFVYFDGLNRFYIANEHAGKLDHHFNSPPNPRDAFIRSSEAIAMDLEHIEATHSAVISALNADAHRFCAERDACIESREAISASLYAALALQENREREIQAEMARVMADHEDAIAALNADVLLLRGELTACIESRQGVSDALHAALALQENREREIRAEMARVMADHENAIAALNADVLLLRGELTACIESRQGVSDALHTARVEKLAADHERLAASGLVTALRLDVDCLTAESSGWMQELFETNRHAASLTQERQHLLERLTALQTLADNVQRAHQTRHAEIEALRRETEAMRNFQAAEVDTLRQQVDAGLRHVDAIRRSTSWRLTLPLRVLRRALRRSPT